MRINNKLESDCMIKKLNLNRMLEGMFRRGEEEKLAQFLKENPFPYYNIRNKSVAMGQFLYKLTPSEVMEHSREYDCFSVYESLAEADKKLILQGDILIDRNFSITASLSDVKGISNRQAMQNPVYKLNMDLVYNPYIKFGEDKFWQRLPNIQGLDTLIDFICTNGLIDVVVELSMFDISSWC